MIRTTFLLSIILLGGEAVCACTCVQVSQRTEFRAASAVFVAKVLDVSEDKSYVPPKLNVSSSIQKSIDSSKRYIVRLRIEQNFKGVAKREIIMHTFQSDSPCTGVTLMQGEKYLIYAVRKNGQLQDGGLCSRTSKLDDTAMGYRELQRSFRKWSK